ncbi:hypothetical protein HPB50_025459 [Hyalomma asiaticum]|uniref:Uncharacterized protein n=1 Tax=Hyalomma asiaticum TaxID=266040 RepID=A0ACB7SA28_HYAAI|nr:hypothetical protein HPB50_025459 [Hyalomma asiaticum]
MARISYSGASGFPYEKECEYLNEIQIEYLIHSLLPETGCFLEGTGLVFSAKKSEFLLFRKARPGMRNLEPLDSLPWTGIEKKKIDTLIRVGLKRILGIPQTTSTERLL